VQHHILVLQTAFFILASITEWTSAQPGIGFAPPVTALPISAENGVPVTTNFPGRVDTMQNIKSHAQN
jgi:hypothetical protein